MRLSTCLAPHSSPEGLRLCSSAFACLCTAAACIRTQPLSVQQACIRSQLHLAAPAHASAPHSSPEGLRLCSMCLRCQGHGGSLHLHAAAACSSAHAPALHTSPEGLRLCSMCLRCQGHGGSLHSQPAAYCQRRARIALVLILLLPAFAGPPSQRLLRLQKSTSRNTSKKQRLTKTTFRNTSEKRSKVWERFCPPAHPSKDLGRAEIQTPL